MKLIVLSFCIAVSIADPTADQFAAAKASWNGIKNNQVDILYAVFKAYPDIHNTFPQFKGKDLDDLKGTVPFKDYVGKIIGLFSTIMDLVGDDANTPKVVQHAKTLGSTHKSRASPQQFDNFGKAVGAYLKANGKGDEASWNAVIGYIFGILKTELKNA